MKVFMIGGTGLLGSEAAKELISRGHTVTSIALPPIPQGAVLPPEMKIDFGNYMEMSDEQLKSYFKDCDAFVFAAGVDERVEGPAPIYEMFKKYNIDPLKRMLALAKEAGVKHSAVCGSYFSYFAKKDKTGSILRWHPYIRSRVDQENAALAFADDSFDVAILELPYIFGAQPGRKPVWVFLAENIKKMKKATLYPRGGTTMVTVHQVAQALAGALERNHGGNCYPIGYYNMTWIQFLTIVHRYMGYENRRIITIPDFMYALGGKKIMKEQKAKGHEAGLHMVRFTKLMCANLFIEHTEGCDFLGVTQDDIDAAIGESILLSMEVINKKTDVVDMKGE